MFPTPPAKVQKPAIASAHVSKKPRLTHQNSQPLPVPLTSTKTKRGSGESSKSSGKKLTQSQSLCDDDDDDDDDDDVHKGEEEDDDPDVIDQPSKQEQKRKGGRRSKNYKPTENVAGLQVYINSVLMNIERRRQDKLWSPVLQAMEEASGAKRVLSSVKAHFETMVRQVQAASSCLSEANEDFRLPEFDYMTEEMTEEYLRQIQELAADLFAWMEVPHNQGICKPKININWYNEESVQLLLQIIIEQADWDKKSNALLNEAVENVKEESKTRAKERKEHLEREEESKRQVRQSFAILASASDRMAKSMESMTSSNQLQQNTSSSSSSSNMNQLDRIEEKVNQIWDFLRSSQDWNK